LNRVKTPREPVQKKSFFYRTHDDDNNGDDDDGGDDDVGDYEVERASGRYIARAREAGTAGALGLSFTTAEKILHKC
jgi:hypothetical protein